MRGWTYLRQAATFGSFATGHMHANALCRWKGGTSYHSTVLSSYEIRILKCLGLSNDARDRRGSGREWRRLNLAFYDNTVALVLTLPSDTIWSPTNRTWLSLAFCLGVKDSYHAGPESKRDTIKNPSGTLPSSDLAPELSMRE